MKRVEFTPRPPATPPADAWVAERVVAPPPAAEPTRRFTFDVPLALHRRIKAWCVERDRVMADVLRELLEREFPPLN